MLLQTLTQHRKLLKRPNEQVRLAVVGIGNELRGDDAAGIAVIRKLNQERTVAKQESVFLVEGGNAPENHTGPLRRFSPHLVLLIDMAQMNQEPGKVCWLPWQETSGLSASSHTMPPYVLARFLTTDMHCDVALIGIQPFDTSLTTAMSTAVQTAVDSIVSGIVNIVNGFYSSSTIN